MNNRDIICQRGGCPIRNLLYFCSNGGNIDEVRRLLKDERVDPNEKCRCSRVSILPSSYSSHEIVNMQLCKWGEEISITDDDIWTPYVIVTPLLLSCANGNVEITRLLLHAGADPHFRGYRSRTPLSIAAEIGNLDTCLTLLDWPGININHGSYGNRTPLMEACIYNHLDIVNILIDRGAMIDVTSHSGDTALTIALSGHNENIANILLDNWNDNLGEDAILHMAYFSRDENLLSRLIERAPDINERDSSGETPLHVAAKHLNDRFACLLLEAGADIDALDSMGQTPLIIACSSIYKKGFLKMAEILIDAGAIIDPENMSGLAVFFRARVHSTSLYNYVVEVSNPPLNIIHAIELDDYPSFARIIEGGIKEAEKREALEKIMLLSDSPMRKKAAEILLRNLSPRDGGTCLYRATISNKLWAVNAFLNAGFNPNHERPLLISRSSDIIRSLIEAGANTDVRDVYGNTPLHLRARDNAECVHTLLEFKADIEAINDEGNTPIHESAKSYNSLALRHLIETGSNISGRNLVGETPLHLVNPRSPCAIDLVTRGANISSMTYFGGKVSLTPEMVAARGTLEQEVREAARDLLNRDIIEYILIPFV